MHSFLARTDSAASKQMESFTGQLLLPLPEHAGFSTACWDEGQLVDKVGVSGLCTRAPKKLRSS